MSARSATEPFPNIASTSRDQLMPLKVNGNKNTTTGMPRARRRSSGLGGEIRAGDTGAPSFSTFDILPQSPTTMKAQIEKDRKKPFSKRRKARTLFQRWKNYALKHTWVTPAILLVICGAMFAVNPTESNPLHHFIFLSYQLPLEPGSEPGTSHQYGKGLWDIAFVAFYIIVLSFTREFIMQMILRPLAIKAGLKSRTKQSRFMEQAYTAVYFAFLGPAGMYVMSRTPVWYFNTRGMYEGFPHKTHEGVFKFYYLFQGAYWAQQMIVLMLGMEKPRKDFRELVGHHIVSVILIAASYRFHFTYMGLAVYITHDISDFFLATSKVLNYIDHWIVGPYFGFFVIVWVYLRHYVNIRILLSEFDEFQTIGPYVLDWAGGQFKCPLSHYISTVLLASLQSLNLFWLYYIFRIAYRFLFSDVLEDSRSDEEGDTEPEDVTSPSILVNGKLVDGAKASGVEVTVDEVTNRKAVI